jgi:formin-binding protein 1
VSNGIKWLDDVQSFYRERAIIEREYSQKLRYLIPFPSFLPQVLKRSTLSKKYLEKKAKKSASLSVGDTPQITPGSLESASLTTWTTILDDLENLSKEREMLANSFNAQVADPIRNLQVRCDDLRKKHVDFAEQLEEERDKVYKDLKECKKAYDARCETLENRRSKKERAYDGEKSKASSSYEKHLHEANNAKVHTLFAAD